ncbi:MAG TPA: hypothetical protein VHO91_12740 [Rhodopila sp.]|nr:hypothetical protein [Rhodopila sp.]
MTNTENTKQPAQTGERPSAAPADPKSSDTKSGTSQKISKDEPDDLGSQTPGQGGPSMGSESTIRSGS